MSTKTDSSAPNPPGGVCKDRSGFLFAHDCDRPAENTCKNCNRPICKQHTRMAAEEPLCIACVKKVHKRLPGSEKDPYWRFEDEYEDYDYYDDDDDDSFDDGDYEAFDSEDAAVAIAATELEQEFDAS